MPRYFLELSYKGTEFKGFQSQENARTIQGEVNKAFSTLLKETIETTTSSRTDAGVHALQNYLHLDVIEPIRPGIVYNINAILNQDIQLRRLIPVPDDAHSRFDALSREYYYYVHQDKNPFLKEISYFYPYKLDLEKMNEAGKLLLKATDFKSFAKKHSDVNNFNCRLSKAIWTLNSKQQLVFHVESNRFLRGMVRALVGTQLLVGRNKINLQQFQQIILAEDCRRADFSAPAHGLFLTRIHYPERILIEDDNVSK